MANNKRIAKMVDAAFDVKQELEDLQEEFDDYKRRLREEAKKLNVNELSGTVAIAKVGPTSSTDCEPLALHGLLKKLKRENEFFDLVSVKITAAKDAIGKTLFGEVSRTTSEPYKRVSFKEIK